MAVSQEECSAAKSRSSSSSSSSNASASAAYYLAKCVLPPSVVLQVAYGHFRSRSHRDAVLGKETSIELVVIGEDGILQSVCEQNVFGTIKDLAVLPWSNQFHARNTETSGKDLLVVISDSGKLSFLSFCNEMHRFSPVAHVQLSGPGNSKEHLGRMLAVDSSGCFVAVSAYQDCLALFSLSITATDDIIDKRFFCPPEYEKEATSAGSFQRKHIAGAIWSICFISKESNKPITQQDPVLAIVLNRRGALLNELILLGWNTRDQYVFVISQYVEDGPLAHTVIEVPNSYGYAFLFRVGDALLMDLRDAYNPCCVYRIFLNTIPAAIREQNFVEKSCNAHDIDDEGLCNVAACALLELRDYDPMCIDTVNEIGKLSFKHVCAWTWEPADNKKPRILLCLDGGEFFILELSFDSESVKVNLSDCLFKGLACKALLWVESGFLAAFVEMGDGMVLKVEDKKLLYMSPIQNIAPVLDMSLVEDNGEKRNQMFACCGVAPEGSLRIIRNGISVEKLLRTSPIYLGITGTWTVSMKVTDSYHSFLVLSFVEETRVLSVGVSFTDVTDSVGFQSDVCTLSCGLVEDGILVQIHQSQVRVCLPSKVAHPEGIPFSSPVYTSWFPNNLSITLGAVGHNLIVVSTSNPCILFVLGIQSHSQYHHEIYEMQHVNLQYELSCISIPRKHIGETRSSSPMNPAESSHTVSLPAVVERGYSFVIGTHRPSVEILSFVDGGVRVLASGLIQLTNLLGTAIRGCIPQDVRLVVADQFYVLSGLRNGMLLRFEWPRVSATSSEVSRECLVVPLENAQTSLTTRDDPPTNLQLVATRRIGITPVSLIPLSELLDADIIALSDRPWLLQTARHSLSYTSISFEPATHATPVCSLECPKGILFVADNCLHLVEMVHGKRLSVQKFQLGGTLRKVLYHRDSRRLIVMRTDLNKDTCASDICCVDPLSGLVQSSFNLEMGETGKSMELVKVGSEQVLVVGTSLHHGPAIMPTGEPESSNGRLIVLCIEHIQNSDSVSSTLCSKAGLSSQRNSPYHDVVGYAVEQLSCSSLCSSPDDGSSEGIKPEESEVWQLKLAYSATWQGMVLAICPYLDRYFLASSGNAFYVCSFLNDNPQRVRRIAVGRTRFMITSLTTYLTKIGVGDCRDGMLLYSYLEDCKMLQQISGDPAQRLVADCILMDEYTAVVSDRKGSIAVLSGIECGEEHPYPERNFTIRCAYYMGEVAMRIRKGSFVYKLPADDVQNGFYEFSRNGNSAQDAVIASTLLGSIFIYIPISREEFEILEAVQARMVFHPLTAPILGNNHNEFRGRENLDGVPRVLDGDMLAQFLELTSYQQQDVLSLPWPVSQTTRSSLKSVYNTSSPSLNRVVQLLERVHYALN